VIQLDCDLIIKHSLEDLWNFELDDNVVAMINEGHCSMHREVLGILGDGNYFNSGVMLMSLDKLRKGSYEVKFTAYMQKSKGYIPVNAQGVFNAVLDGRIAKLPLRFNVHPLLYAFTYKQYLRLRKPKYFYTEQEYLEAVRDPMIIHYMTCFYMDVRPWMEGCIHPKRDEYYKYKAISPWKDIPLWEQKRKPMRKAYFNIVHHMPKSIAITLSSFLYTHVIPMQHRRMQRKFQKVVETV
jgi:lipopolysaccharide biosynthesis glycosyltransferase